MRNEKPDTLHRPVRGDRVLQVILILAFLILATAIIFPMFVGGPTTRTVRCQSNVRQLVTALLMYCSDYDNRLPSSALHQRVGGKWDARTSAEFCAERGPVLPPAARRPEDVHWVQLLWPKMKNKDAIWCPSDSHRRGPGAETDLVSYVYRPAFDRASFTGTGVRIPSGTTDDSPARRQIVLFERNPKHWPTEGKGWRDGERLVCAYLDGHCRFVRLRNAVGCDTPKTASELAEAMPRGGEPLWFNYDGRRSTDSTYKGERGVLVDPRVYHDILP